jgi:urea transport system substrate-binding protein
MSISENSLVDAVFMAIEEINNSGGIIGKKIEPILLDGASDWPTFSEKAQVLIDQYQVSAVFGCWTSASRKAVLPVFEFKNHLLYYPVQYEGQECSQQIFYSGAAPNQQIEPSVEWLLTNKGKNFFLIGSDYVFPRTANKIIKNQLAALGGQVFGEIYIPLGSTNVEFAIKEILKVLPTGGCIYNTLNGDSNVIFFILFKKYKMTPDKWTTMSVSIAESEVQSIGIEYLLGHYAAWNYFQTVDTPENKKFVANFKKKYGENRVINDPMEAGYIAIYLWKQAVEKAGTEDILQVRKNTMGQKFKAPEGEVEFGNNHHLSKWVRIGVVRSDGLFDIVYEEKSSRIARPWNQYVAETSNNTCDWSKDP